MFPPGPGAAPLSRESNSSVLLTLIAVLVFFPLVTLLSDAVPVFFPLVTVLPDVTDVTVVGESGGGRSSKGGGVAPR